MLNYGVAADKRNRYVLPVLYYSLMSKCMYPVIIQIPL